MQLCPIFQTLPLRLEGKLGIFNRVQFFAAEHETKKKYSPRAIYQPHKGTLTLTWLVSSENATGTNCYSGSRPHDGAVIGALQQYQVPPTVPVTPANVDRCHQLEQAQHMWETLRKCAVGLGWSTTMVVEAYKWTEFALAPRYLRVQFDIKKGPVLAQFIGVSQPVTTLRHVPDTVRQDIDDATMLD